MKALLWITLLLGAAASLLLSRDIATQTLVLGDRAAGWHYFYLSPFKWWPVVVWALTAAGTIGAVWVSERWLQTREWLVVPAWFVLALAIQGAVCSLAPFRFDKIFASDGANSFNAVAQRYTPRTMLSDFMQVRKFWPLHAPNNMPGKSVLVYWLRKISKRIDVLPWLVLAVSNLGGLFMYGLVRDLLNDRRAAFYALVLYAIVPGKMFFFPILNTVTPVFVLLSAWLIVRWLKTRNVLYAAAFGASLYLMTLFEPLGLVIGLLFLGWVVAAMARGAIHGRTFLWEGAVAIAAFAGAYAAFYAWFRFDMISTVRMLADEAIRFNIVVRRPYDFWIRANLREFLVAMGACQLVLAVAALVDGFWRGTDLRRRFTEPMVVFVLGLTAVVAATDLIGINRGEVVRLWIFLACFAQVPAAYVCSRLGSRVAISLLIAVTLLHDALGTAMIGFILPG